MNTEQQLRERAEAIFPFDDYAHNPECNYHHIISKMLDFHKQELQRIGEVVYVPCTEDEAISAFMKDSDEWEQYLGTQIGWLKKLSLLEGKDLDASDNATMKPNCDAPFKSTNSI